MKILASIKNALLYRDDNSVDTEERMGLYKSRLSKAKTNRELLSIIIGVILNAVGLKIVDNQEDTIPPGVYLTKIQKKRRKMAEDTNFLVGLS